MAYTFLKPRRRYRKSLLEQTRSKWPPADAQASRLVKLLLPIDHVAGDSEKKNPITLTAQYGDRMGLDIDLDDANFPSEIRKANVLGMDGRIFEVGHTT